MSTDPFDPSDLIAHIDDSLLHPEEGRDPAQPDDGTGALGAAPAGAADFPTEGSPPFINRRLSVAEWKSYVAGYDFGRLPPSRLVLHHTVIPTESQWAGLSTMRGMQRYYAGLGWTSAPHIYAGPDGIWLATPMSRVGIHAGAGNGSVAQGWYSIGLEMVGFFDHKLPGGRVWEHALAVIGELSRRLQIPPRQLISFHRDYTSAKSCPGWAVKHTWVWEQVEAYLAAAAARAYQVRARTPVREAPRPDAPVAWGGTCILPAGEVVDLAPTADPAWLHWAPNGFVAAADVAPVVPPGTVTTGYTELSPILAAPLFDERALLDAFYARCLAAGSPYARELADPIRRVIGAETIRLCRIGGVDPFVALAQFGHECGWGVSALSQRTDKDGRDLRNGYGAGVYEAKAHATPHYRPGCVWDADVRGYRPAMGFARWEDAVLWQVGRLVAYATKPSERTPEQQQLVDRAALVGVPRRPLPPDLHGSAPRLRQLGKAHNPQGAGWASPGTDYGAKLAEKAEALRRAAGGR